MRCLPSTSAPYRGSTVGRSLLLQAQNLLPNIGQEACWQQPALHVDGLRPRANLGGCRAIHDVAWTEQASFATVAIYRKWPHLTRSIRWRHAQSHGACFDFVTGEQGGHIVELVRKNPAVALGVVLVRLLQKDTEW